MAPPPTHLHFEVMLKSLIGLIAPDHFINSTEASLHTEYVGSWSAALPLSSQKFS